MTAVCQARRGEGGGRGRRSWKEQLSYFLTLSAAVGQLSAAREGRETAGQNSSAKSWPFFSSFGGGQLLVCCYVSAVGGSAVSCWSAVLQFKAMHNRGVKKLCPFVISFYYASASTTQGILCKSRQHIICIIQVQVQHKFDYALCQFKYNIWSIIQVQSKVLYYASSSIQNKVYYASSSTIYCKVYYASTI